MGKRLFIAVDIIAEPEFIDFFNEFREKFQEEKIKWVDKSIFHLTLRFLGETEEKRIETIKSTLSDICKNFSPFSFRIKGLGYFGSKNKPGVVFSGIENDHVLNEIGILINQKLFEIGFEKGQKKFHPHLTLGRIIRITNKPAFFSEIEKYNEVFFQDIKIKEIVLYESILKQQGPVYIPLKIFKF